jgi:hypothetical protein
MKESGFDKWAFAFRAESGENAKTCSEFTKPREDRHRLF